MIPTVSLRACLLSAGLLLPLPVALAAAPAATLQQPEDDDPATAADDDEQVHWKDDLVRKRKTASIGSELFSYDTTTGSMTLTQENGDERADIFFVAYTKAGVDDLSERPITFTFNGGPGSSSVWLHMGAFGPRRVPMTGDETPPPPPYPIIDNIHSILDLTDLVFIDPVTTGYSRAADGQDDSQFHGVQEDIESVADFIRLYTTRFQRWNSPKFLAGESYGTTRAAGLAGHLQGRHGMYLNGLVLVSSILEFGTARFDAGNDLPYPLFLPTYTASAWYHGRLDGDLQADLGAALAASEEFALGDYMLALAKGASLPDAERASIAARLAQLTGLAPEYVEQTNLRIVIHEFIKELTRDQRHTIGRLDSRFRGLDADAAGDTNDYDPSYTAIQGPYTAALNQYMRAELGYENDLPYEILSGRVHPWNYGNRNSYVNTAATLRSAMSQNPHLQVFVANGYYDLATPYFATEYTFNHLGIEPQLRPNISMTYYEAGHIMYIHEPSAAKLKADLVAFYAKALDRSN
jgi:carboxypeptidase C (cathepsin A)